MKTALDCIPCLIRQTLESARFVSDDPSIHQEVMRRVLRLTADMDLASSPPEIARQIHRDLRRITGVQDPYKEIKQRFNRMVLDMMPMLYSRLRTAADPFAMAVRLAIAGNVIDLGVDGSLTIAQARHAMEVCLEEPFHGNIAALRRAVDQAEDILYLADNAGEIVCDRLLIEQLPMERVTVAVRGGPIINDATMDDAKIAGLPDLVPVVDNGSRAPGTILTDCSEEFRQRFNKAGLVIAKGQGNFESLSNSKATVFFLFKVKCDVIANNVGLAKGTHVVMHRLGT